MSNSNDLFNSILLEYLENILEINKYLNLTRVTDIEEAKLLLLEDSLSVLKEINEAPEGLYGDMGSGGGFPGVPLGVYTGRDTILIDSVAKKMQAVESILQKLNISNISTYKDRLENLSKEKPAEFSVLTAKALSKIPSLIELASPLLVNGGHLIALKSHEEEKFNNKDLEYKLGMKLVKEREYNLSDGESFRKVFVFEKFKDPEVKLPRKLGLAQKRPYK